MRDSAYFHIAFSYVLAYLQAICLSIKCAKSISSAYHCQSEKHCVCLYHYYPQFSSFFIVLVLFNHNVGFMHVVGRLFSSLKLRSSGILMGLYPFSFFRSSIYDRKTIFNAQFFVLSYFSWNCTLYMVLPDKLIKFMLLKMI